MLFSLSFSLLQDIFVSLSQVDGLYFVCNIDDFKFLAEMIQHIPLNLRSRYVFCTAPINKKQPFVCTSFLKVRLYGHEEGRKGWDTGMEGEENKLKEDEAKLV